MLNPYSRSNISILMLLKTLILLPFNRNTRCIETRMEAAYAKNPYDLTVTRGVLKQLLAIANNIASNI